MWFQKAEHMQTHLKSSPLHSVPTMGAYNAVDVLPSHIFPLLESVKNIFGHSHFILQAKPNLREVIFFLLRKKCTTRVINDL